MMRLAAALLALSAASALSACEPEESTPRAPVTGIWRISRTVHVTAGTDCPTMNANDFTLIVSSGEVNEVSVVDNHLWEDAEAPTVTPTHVAFETEEFIFSENQNPVLIGHELDVVGDQLVGTGVASGDGPYIDCHWTLDLVGTREGESCKAGGGCAR